MEKQPKLRIPTPKGLVIISITRHGTMQYILPLGADGAWIRAFKEEHRKLIQQFKDLYTWKRLVAGDDLAI